MADTKKLTRKEKFSNVSTKPEKQHAANNHSKWSNYYVWIVAVLAMVVYFNTISFDYALDDYASIIENRSTQKGDFKEIFKTSYRYGSYLASDEL